MYYNDRKGKGGCGWFRLRLDRHLALSLGGIFALCARRDPHTPGELGQPNDLHNLYATYRLTSLVNDVEQMNLSKIAEHVFSATIPSLVTPWSTRPGGPNPRTEPPTHYLYLQRTLSFLCTP